MTTTLDNATLAAMTIEVREVNTAKGWRTGDNTFGDYCALFASEVAEMLEAYRDHRLADATKIDEQPRTALDVVKLVTGETPLKPEGVGSEMADTLIRLVDMADVFGYRLRAASGPDAFMIPVTFGDWCALLTARISHALETYHRCSNAIRYMVSDALSDTLTTLTAMADVHGVDLVAEYRRKIAYNRTRPFQHGGRTLSDPTPAP